METRERNHAHAKVHGSARQLAWLDFATCMVQLSEVHGSAFVVAWMDSKSPILASKITLAICRKSPPLQKSGIRVTQSTQVSSIAFSLHINFGCIRYSFYVHRPWRNTRRARPLWFPREGATYRTPSKPDDVDGLAVHGLVAAVYLLVPGLLLRLLEYRHPAFGKPERVKVFHALRVRLRALEVG